MSVNDRLARAGEFLKFTLEVFWTVVLVLASYVFNRPIAGHALKIGRISLKNLSIHDVHYCGALYDRDYTYTFTAPTVSMAFCLPRPSYPCWLKLHGNNFCYTSTTCDLSVATLDVTIWLFPYLSRRTAGPWMSAVIDGFKIRVHKSSATPYWIQKLRQNVVAALFQGEIMRLDDFWSSVRFAGLSEPFTSGKPKKRRRRAEAPLSAARPILTELDDDCYDSHDSTSGDESDSSQADDLSTADGSEGESRHDDTHKHNGLDSVNHRDPPPPFTNTDSDELRVSASARQLHLNNTEGRIYTFGALDAQLRRDWDEDRGSFVLVAEESRWVRVHWPYQRSATSWWPQLITSLVQFPLDVVHIMKHPMTAVNLYVPRTDITFDEFRIRDAALIIQTLTILRAKTARLGINWGDVLFDAAVQAFIRP